MKKDCCQDCEYFDRNQCIEEMPDDCDQDDIPTVEIQVPQEILEKAKENADTD